MRGPASTPFLLARVAELTGGKFQIRALAGGDIVPPAQNFDAVSNGTVECNHVLASAPAATERLKAHLAWRRVVDWHGAS